MDISTDRSRWHSAPLLALVDVVVVSALDAVVVDSSVMQQEVVDVGGLQSGMLSMMLVDRHSNRRRISDDKASVVAVGDRDGALKFAPGLVVVGSPPLVLSYLTPSICFFDGDNNDDEEVGCVDRRPTTIFVRYMICSGIQYRDDIVAVMSMNSMQRKRKSACTETALFAADVLSHSLFSSNLNLIVVFLNDAKRFLDEKVFKHVHVHSIKS